MDNVAKNAKNHRKLKSKMSAGAIGGTVPLLPPCGTGLALSLPVVIGKCPDGQGLSTYAYHYEVQYQYAV